MKTSDLKGLLVASQRQDPDPEMMSALIAALVPMLNRVSRGDCDVKQAALLHLWINRHSYAPIAGRPATAWCLTVLSRAATRARSGLRKGPPCLSLDADLGRGPIYDSVPDDVTVEKARESDLHREAVELIEHALCSLDQRSADVVRLHYGLGGMACGLPVATIAESYGVTGERIRQILRDAQASLRGIICHATA